MTDQYRFIRCVFFKLINNNNDQLDPSILSKRAHASLLYTV